MKRIFKLLLVIILGIGLIACSNNNGADDHDHDHEDHGEEHEHEHTHGEYEWIGTFEFEDGTYLLHFGPSEDETMDLGIVKLGSNITDLEHHAAHLMDIDDKEEVAQDSTFDAMPDYVYTLEMNPDHGHIHFTISEAGEYALVTEHHPSEFNMQVFDKDENEVMPIKEFGEAHDHDHDHDHDNDEEEHGHEHGEYEWIGKFEFEPGEYLFHFGACEDETMDVGFVKLGANVTDLEHHASHLMAIDEKEEVAQDSAFVAMPDYVYTFEMNPDHGHIHFTIEEEGEYAIVTEHLPSESNMQIFDSEKVEILPFEEAEFHGHDHDH